MRWQEFLLQPGSCCLAITNICCASATTQTAAPQLDLQLLLDVFNGIRWCHRIDAGHHGACGRLLLVLGLPGISNMPAEQQCEPIKPRLLCRRTISV